MNELLNNIISIQGMKLIFALPNSPETAIGTHKLSIKAKVPMTSTFRIMPILAQWPNIGSIDNPSSFRVKILYYIKKRNFAVIFNKYGVRLKV